MGRGPVANGADGEKSGTFLFDAAGAGAVANGAGGEKTGMFPNQAPDKTRILDMIAKVWT
nr:hypothetical protein GCM10020063_065320 [Dactylosporangium thailandense]